MTKFFTCLLLCFGCQELSFGGTAIFDYEDFGPQVAVYELIGFQWWQWESHGDPDPGNKAAIKVVVYWNEPLTTVKTRYPVIPEKKQDYRYLVYDKARDHLQKLIQAFEDSDMQADRLRATLKQIQKLQISSKPLE